MSRLPIRLVLSERDSALISEMATTTESTNARGGKSYYPQVKDKEHATDAVRAARLAIAALRDEGERGAGAYGGWAGTKPFRGVPLDAAYHDDDDETDGPRKKEADDDWAAPW